MLILELSQWLARDKIFALGGQAFDRDTKPNGCYTNDKRYCTWYDSEGSTNSSDIGNHKSEKSSLCQIGGTPL